MRICVIDKTMSGCLELVVLLKMSRYCALTSASDEDGRGSMSKPEDLASVIARRQRQVTTAGLAPAGL